MSLRINEEEWDALQESMNRLAYKNVSDLMRDAFRIVLKTSTTVSG